MLEKIKKFVKSVPTTTWMIVGVGLLVFVVLSLSTCHAKPAVAQPVVVEAPAAQ
jgi:hypothetical protein